MSNFYLEKKIIPDDKKNSITLNWTIAKTYLLLSITLLSSIIWAKYQLYFMPLLIPLLISWFIISIIISFKENLTKYLAPIYTVIFWLLLWVISIKFETLYNWIILQAITWTFWIFFIMLWLFKYNIIKVTEKFRSIVISSTLWIMLIYIISLFWSMTWWFNIPYIHDNWLFWILFSVFVVIVASFNLVLDFDNIQKWILNKAPKNYEWIASFGLTVTIIWLYIEILKLIAKIRWD